MLRNQQRAVVRILAVAAVLAGFCLASYARPQAKPTTTQPQAPKAKTAAAPASATQAPAKTAAKPAPTGTQAKPAAAKPAAAKAPTTAVAKKAPATAVAKKAPAKAEAKKAPVKAEAKKEAPPAPPVAAGRRDPFRSLLVKPEQAAQVLPPGKKGLVIAQLSIDGIIRSPTGMIAMVSNPQKRTYFLRVKDEVYQGHVERITAEAVIFKENAVDPFGKSFTREVVKRLYAVAGEAR